MKILVTRALQDSLEFAEMLRQRGFESVIRPGIAIDLPEARAALESALRKAEAADWVIFTSLNAVRAIGGRLRGSAKIASVGPSTTKALQDLGLQVSREAPEGNARSLAESMAKELQDKTAVWFKGNLAEDVFEESSVFAVQAYATRLLEWEEDVEEIDCMVFASGSAARATFANLQKFGHENWVREKPTITMGTQTRKTAEQLGYNVAGYAKAPTLTALIDAIEEVSRVG